jgi:hypothetical protein
LLPVVVRRNQNGINNNSGRGLLEFNAVLGYGNSSLAPLDPPQRDLQNN